MVLSFMRNPSLEAVNSFLKSSPYGKEAKYFMLVAGQIIPSGHMTLIQRRLNVDATS